LFLEIPICDVVLAWGINANDTSENGRLVDFEIILLHVHCPMYTLSPDVVIGVDVS
jgi:hypothetical protein